ncbi:TauD/TfdA family dioxygenase [Kitasatospora sp. NPDC059811]|uniref:TauD/TfdA family dioxygenase n=1 Tax=Streptomycetaceae TaxID=2062 RepID=UPI0007AF3BFF|nr:TauD/TfdA family dioxygenase [Streptomyces sp. MJM8645]
MPTSVLRLELTDSEALQVRKLLDDVLLDPRILDQHYFLEQAHVIAHELPRRIRETFYSFKRNEREVALHMVGSPATRGALSPTPTRYVETEPGYEINESQVLHGLYGSLLGEPIGYVSQRAGSLFNSIIPIPGLAGVANSSSGSNHDFGFHIEDAFHPTRPDFLGLVCLRNDEGAGTTLSSIEGIDTLTPQEWEVLWEPRFRIGHNPIHETSGVIDEEQQSIFFGNRENPYFRVNFAALRIDELTGIERTALEKLHEFLQRNKVTLVLRGGEFVYVDNYRCAHARDAYTPLPEGRSRWLSRLCVTNDLRKSSMLRADTMSRAIAA